MDRGSHLQQAHEDAEEVKVIMLDNLVKVQEREEKLSELDVRAEELLAKGKAFEKKTMQVKERTMWANKKTKILVVAAAVLVLVVVVVLICVYVGPQ